MDAFVPRKRLEVAVEPLGRGPLADLVGVERHERRQVGPAIADDDRLRDVTGSLELVLEVLRRDVLASARDEDVLLPAGDPAEASRVDLGDLPGAQPPLAG